MGLLSYLLGNVEVTQAGAEGVEQEAGQGKCAGWSKTPYFATVQYSTEKLLHCRHPLKLVSCLTGYVRILTMYGKVIDHMT